LPMPKKKEQRSCDVDILYFAALFRCLEAKIKVSTTNERV